MGQTNLYELFAAAYSGDPGRHIIINHNVSMELVDRRTARYGNFFLELGLGPGDRICACIDKSVEALLLYLACLRAGCVFMPLNPAFTTAELEYFIGDARPALLLCKPDRFEEFNGLAGQHGITHVYTLDTDNRGSFPEATANCAQAFTTIARNSNDLAALLYSSGTTGQPKGIGISHGNLIANARALATAWQFSRDDILLHALPVFHVHGLFIALGCTLLSGARIILLPVFAVEEVLEQLPAATVFMGVPTYYARLLEHEDFNAETSTNIRLFASGSAPLPAALFRRIAENTGHDPLERYGMTETGVITLNPLLGERRPGSVGKPLPGVSIRIVDKSDNELTAGQKGELLVRGDNVFSGYWQNPDATLDAFTVDGYFRTGDVAAISADGYVTIAGRNKDMIISGGENVYPREVENCIDDIDGVTESAVFGIRDADYGERVIAAIVTNRDFDLDETGLITLLKQRLAGFKVPKEIHTVGSLPRNTMGKVLKNRLREQFSK